MESAPEEKRGGREGGVAEPDFDDTCDQTACLMYIHGLNLRVNIIATPVFGR